MKNVEDLYPLSPVQTGMLFHTIQAPRAGSYFQQYTCRITGQLEVEVLAQAWQKVVARHPILRTAFIWEEIDQPLQVVRQHVSVPFEVQDWRSLDPDEQQIRFEQFLADDRTQGFALAKAPLMRVNVIQLAPAHFRMVWSFHHMIADGWSTPLVLKEVFTYYEALRRGQEISLPIPRPYRDYVAWLQRQDLEAAQEYWQRELGGIKGPTRLPVQRVHAGPGGAGKTGYAEQTQPLPASTAATLQVLAQENRLTLGTLMQGAWALLLSRYTGDDDVIYGLTMAGRPTALQGVEEMVGMFVNSLPARVRIPAEMPLIPWLKTIQTSQLEMRQFEYTPLASVQRWSELPAGTPLFETLFVFENYPLVATSLLGTDSSLEIHDVRYLEHSNYPLSLLVIPGDGLTLQCIYDRAEYEDATITRLMSHLSTLLDNMAQQPQQTLASFSLLPEAERHQILVTWNQTTAPFPQHRCIHSLIEEQAQRIPDATAVIFDHERLSYRDLNQRASQLARYLRGLGVGPNVPVGICMERSLEMIVAIVGVLKAGGAYVPLDPDYPAARLEYILNDTRAPVLLTQRKLLQDLPTGQAQVVCMDADWPHIVQHGSTHNGNGFHLADDVPGLTSDCLAYIIYTSGSTGQPKGVPITHRNLVHSTTARFQFYPDPVKTFLLLSSFAFDSSVVGIFWTLCQGGALLLPVKRQEQDVQQLAASIARHQVTHTLCLPSLYDLILAYALPGALTSLQTVIVAGEACPPKLAAHHYSRLLQATLYNEYGPTEGTVWSTAYCLPPDSMDAPVPIGRPIANMQAYILDATRQPVPVGVPGELYIGGAGLASGYLNRPDLTTSRFVPHPFHPEPGACLYRTGDLACYRPDGNILFLGRMDDQIKLRGYRIEPGEIETLLAQHAGVETAAVILTSAWQHPPDGAESDSADPHTLTDLAVRLAAVEEGAERLLAEIEDLSDQEVEAMLATVTENAI